jgi:Ni/Co efflux regulator RcnB
MNSKLALAAFTAISLTLSDLACAQDRDREREGDRGRDEHMQRGGQDRGPGAGPNHEFHRGERLSSQYHNKNYVVDDWRNHHLSPPPRGHHWVQIGGDYVLVAIATGIIAQVLLGH